MLQKSILDYPKHKLSKSELNTEKFIVIQNKL